MALDILRVIFLLFFYIYIHVSLFPASSSPPPPVAGDIWRWLSVDDLFLAFKATFFFRFYFLLFLPASLPCRSEVWEWDWESASSTRVLACGIGVSMNFP